MVIEVNYGVNDDGVMRIRNRVCFLDVPELKKSILEEGHRSRLSIHPGATKMYQDVKKLFWQPGMKKEIVNLIYACFPCQKSKYGYQKLMGIMYPLSIPEWKWDIISMNFVTGLPKTVRGNDSIWEIVDRLTKSMHFMLMKIEHPMEKLVEMYIEEILRLHGIPSSIVSDRDLRFTSRFLKGLKNDLGAKLRLCFLCHPQPHGQPGQSSRS